MIDLGAHIFVVLLLRLLNRLFKFYAVVLRVFQTNWCPHIHREPMYLCLLLYAATLALIHPHVFLIGRRKLHILAEVFYIVSLRITLDWVAPAVALQSLKLNHNAAFVFARLNHRHCRVFLLPCRYFGLWQTLHQICFLLEPVYVNTCLDGASIYLRPHTTLRFHYCRMGLLSKVFRV